MIKHVLLIMLTWPAVLPAQVLDRYVAEALAQNEQLKQKEIQLEKSLAALAEARGLFWPEVSFSTTYTRAEGGRTIDLPLGDLLNPVYGTLNQLTNSNQFPTLENRRELLNPDDFYDAKIRAVWPLLNAEIRFNRLIRQNLAEMRRYEAEVYRRELAKEVKAAWFSYRQAREAVGIYTAATELTQAAERVNARLVQNGKALPLALRRAQNETVKMEAQVAAAKDMEARARQYFNFLLNRELSAGVETDDPQLDVTSKPGPVAVEQRAELAQLDQALAAAGGAVALEQRFHQPKLNVFLDAGSQGFEREVNRSTWYYLGGVQLTVPLFTGGRHRERLKQVRADREVLESQRAALKQQLLLQQRSSVDAFETAWALLESARTQRNFAETYYADMERLYKEGALLYIELLDAQNQLTGARLQESIAQSRLGIRQAELERAMAGRTL